jgi:hypothetical protein
MDKQKENENAAIDAAKKRGASEQELVAIADEYEKIVRQIWEDSVTVKKLEGMTVDEIMKKYGATRFEASELQEGGFGHMKEEGAARGFSWEFAGQREAEIKQSKGWKEDEAARMTSLPRDTKKDVRRVDSAGYVDLSKGDIAIDSDELARIDSGGKGSAFPQLMEAMFGSGGGTLGGSRGGVGSAGAASTFGTRGDIARGRGGRAEPVVQEIRIKLEGEGVLTGLRKEIILAVEDGVVKGTRKTEHAVVR